MYFLKRLIARFDISLFQEKRASLRVSKDARDKWQIHGYDHHSFHEVPLVRTPMTFLTLSSSNFISSSFLLHFITLRSNSAKKSKVLRFGA